MLDENNNNFQLTVRNISETDTDDIKNILSPVDREDEIMCIAMAEDIAKQEGGFIAEIEKEPIAAFQIYDSYESDNGAIARSTVHIKDGYEFAREKVVQTLEWNAIKQRFNGVSIFPTTAEEEEYLINNEDYVAELDNDTDANPEDRFNQHKVYIKDLTKNFKLG